MKKKVTLWCNNRDIHLFQIIVKSIFTIILFLGVKLSSSFSTNIYTYSSFHSFISSEDLFSFSDSTLNNSFNSNQSSNLPPVIIFIEPVADVCLDANFQIISMAVTIQGGDGTGLGFWSGPGITPDGNFNPSLANIGANQIYYTFTENGCTVVESTIINVNFIPQASFTVSSPLCLDDVSQINATPLAEANYIWDFDGAIIHSGNNSGPYEVTWTVADTHYISLTVIDSNNCASNMTTEMVEVIAPLEPPVLNCNTSNSMIEFSWDSVDGATGYDINVLSGSTGVLNGNNYSISSLAMNDSVTIELIINGAPPCGDTSVIQTCYANNCPHIIIDLDPVPDFCYTNGIPPFSLIANVSNSDNSGTGIWNGNGILDTLTGLFDPNDPALTYGPNLITYTFMEDSCLFAETMTINVFRTPELSIAPSDPISCEDLQITLNANITGSNLDIHWSGGNIIADHLSSMPIVDQSGWYYITVTDSLSSCTNSDSVFVGIDSIVPLAIIQNPLDTIDCLITALSLQGMEVPHSTYQWVHSNGGILGTAPDIMVEEPGWYTFNVLDTLNGCIGSENIEVIDISGYPVINLETPNNLTCSISEIKLNGNNSQIGPSFIIEWSGPIGGISGPTDALITTAVLPGLYTLTLTDTLNGCSNDSSIMVNLIDDAPTAVTNIPENLDCNTFMVELSGINSIGIGSLTYEWLFNNTSISHDISTNVNAEGHYSLIVIDESNNCTDTTSIEVTKNENTIRRASIDIEEPSCYGLSDGTLFVSQVFGGSPDYQYSIDSSDYSDNNFFENLSAGEHTLSIIDKENCSWETAVFIHSPPKLELILGNEINLQLGESTTVPIQFNILESELDTIIWSPMDQLVCIDSLSSICKEVYIYPLDNLVISATMIDKTGCSVKSELLVNVKKDKLVFIPNIFSPNGDNKNDRFMIFGGQGIGKVNQFSVYDRLGEKMFEAHDFLPNDPDYGWDGNLEGAPMSPAVFVYWAEVQLIDGQTTILKGNVTLIR